MTATHVRPPHHAAPPERVLMSADTIGGVWTYALELARGLIERGVAVSLATMGAPLSREQRREVESLPALDLHESLFKLEWMDDSWRDVESAGAWLADLAEQLRPDVVHLNGYAHGAAFASARRPPVLIVAHSCVFSWWRAVKGEDPPETAWTQSYRQAVVRGLRCADAVVAPSRAMLGALRELYGDFAADGRVVYNGRSGDSFAPGPKQDFVFAAGRLWDEAKNVGALERIAPLLPWPVLVAGDRRHPTTDEVVSAGDNVCHLGQLSARRMADQFARAAIYAAPARYEPFGLSALEAALANCALVLGDIPSLREVWGDAATYVDPNDEAALAHTLRRLIADSSLRRALADRARERALDYDAGRMTRGYLDVYARLVARRPVAKFAAKEVHPICAS